MSTFEISPDWQPIETAPRDGTVVNLFARSRVWNTGEPTTHVYYRYKWGVMLAFPNSGEFWVPEKNEYPNDNVHLLDEEFVDVLYSSFYCPEQMKRLGKSESEVWRYDGFKVTHWAYPWEFRIMEPL